MATWDEERIALKQRLAAEGIASVLSVLKERLPKQGEWYEDVLLLESRQNDANRKRLRNLLSDEELRRLYAQIRQDIMDLLDALQEDDFDAEAAAQKQTDSESDRGNILYRIPDQMQIGAWTKCIVRISFDEEKLIENIDLDEHVELDEIRISEVMRVELIDPDDNPPFSIQTIHSPEQFIGRDTYTEWLFRVKPLREGRFPLMLKVSVIELIMGKERKRELVLTEEVIITAAASDREEEEQPLQSAGYFSTGGSGPAGREEEAAYPDATGEPPAPRVNYRQDTSSKRSVTEPIEPAPIPQDDTSSTRSGSTFRFILRSLTVGLLAFGGLFGALYALNPAEGAWLATHYVKKDVESYQEYVEKYPQSSHTERAFWQVARLKEDNEDYLTYLERYPRGKFTDSALQTMQQREVLPDHLQQKDLARVKNVRELAQETIDWKESVQEADRASNLSKKQDIIEDYVRKHPDTYYAPEVNILQKQLNEGRWEVDAIKQTDSRVDVVRPDQKESLSDRQRNRLLPVQRDSLAWLKVRESGGKEAAVKAYLEAHPQGIFADKARRILAIREEESTLQKEITRPEFEQSPDAGAKLNQYRNLLRENIETIDPPSGEDLLNLLEQKLPRDAPERNDLQKLRSEWSDIEKQLKAGEISKEEAQERRQRVRQDLQRIVDNL